MQNISELSQFDANVPYVEITDPVIGGTGGESNSAAIPLANRTRYLYDYLNGFTGVAELTANTTLGTAHLRKLIYINITSHTAFTLAPLANFLTGQKLVIKVKAAAGKWASIAPDGSEVIADGNSTSIIVWLYDGEEITLVKRSSTAWEIINAYGNFDKVGNDALVRFQPKNTLTAQGQEVSRSDYARLFAKIEATAITDAQWFISGINYNGFYSLGNGVSTFRLPDMRAMHWRALDLGRGISLAETGSGPGAYVADDVKAHNHTIGNFTKLLKVDGHFTYQTGDDSPNEPNLVTSGDMQPYGVEETRVKATSLTPVVYY